MENKNKNVWTWIVVIVVVVLVIVFWSIHSRVPATEVDTTGVTTPAPTAVTPTEDTSTGSVDASATASISYANALIKYANARLQLDATCQASPAALTFRNNALLMVDNRAPVARTVHIGSVFTVKAYSFKIIQLSSTTLPATWLVDCDGSQNVATVLIQK